MWGTSVDDAAQSRTDGRRQLNRWHSDAPPQGYTTTQYQTHNPEDAEDPSSSSSRTGTWGEQDAGETDENVAKEDFDALRRELTNLSKSRSRDAATTRSLSHRKSRTSTNADVEAQAGDGAGGGEADANDFELDQFMREGHFEKRTEGRSAKKVGVVYKNLTVKGVGSQATFVKTLPSAVIGTFGPDLYHLLSRFIPFLRVKGGEQRDLIHDFSGVVRDGGSNLTRILFPLTRSRRDDACARQTRRRMLDFPKSDRQQQRIICRS